MRGSRHLTTFAVGLLLAFAPPSDAIGGDLTAGGSHMREDHSGEDHSGENLRDIVLTESELSEIDLYDSDLKNAIFVDAILVGADLSGAEIEDADFTGADLRDADLRGAIAEGAIFLDAELCHAVIDGADLEDAVFFGADLRSVDLSTAENTDSARFDTAYFDESTVLNAEMDSSGMYEVTGECPSDPSLIHIDTDGDGQGDECHQLTPLPEPGALALISGTALLFALSRRRVR
jgi:hypothetical protein